MSNRTIHLGTLMRQWNIGGKREVLANILNWLSGIDIVYYLAFFAGAILNGIFVTHSSLSDGEGLVEAVCIGIVLSRLLKK
jgi:hypothetical protein